MKSRFSILIKNTNAFFVYHCVIIFDTWHQKCVETWYQELHKICIDSDITSVCIINKFKDPPPAYFNRNCVKNHTGK